PLRNKGYKWYVPREVFAEATYPPYCGGPAYVLSGDVARRVFAAAQRVPLINMEDAFVGLCLRALRVRPALPPPGLFNMMRVPFERCRFARLV
ncbi:B3GT2 galactosyltransferase, partial [Nothocercus julius]|nr:B3GT2 galactosyltransferase [Nothocercus julius]